MVLSSQDLACAWTKIPWKWILFNNTQEIQQPFRLSRKKWFTAYYLKWDWFYAPPLKSLIKGLLLYLKLFKFRVCPYVTSLVSVIQKCLFSLQGKEAFQPARLSLYRSPYWDHEAWQGLHQCWTARESGCTLLSAAKSKAVKFQEARY